MLLQNTFYTLTTSETTKMKIYDCFLFFNELELLEIRLNVLNDYVDYFVLVESTKTFSNKDSDKKSVVLIEYPRKGVGSRICYKRKYW